MLFATHALFSALLSLLLGAALNFVIVVPIMISLGEIQPRAGSIAEGTALFGRAHTDWHALAADARYDGAREALRRFEQGVA